MDWSSLNAFWEWLKALWAEVLPAGRVQFPSEPAENEVFGRFKWNADKGTWDFS
jgi:hypothetical protein